MIRFLSEYERFKDSRSQVVMKKETKKKTNETLWLRDGRLLGYAEYGDLDGKPVFFFHGWPGSRLQARLQIKWHHDSAFASSPQIGLGLDSLILLRIAPSPAGPTM